MKNTLLLFLLLSFWGPNAFAQFDKKVIKIGLFTPLHLDKSFDSTGKNLLKPNEFPRQAISGLEVYEGAYMAVDSLNKNGIRVRMKVFDTQSESGSISKCVEKSEFEDLDIIFGHGNLSEIQQLSVIANEYKLPFVNINLPNNKGIVNSPFTYVANPTLETHMSFLVQKINQKWANQNILWIRRNSPTDEILEKTFDEKNAKSGLPSIPKKTLGVDPQFKWNSLVNDIDTTKNNIIVIGSLDNGFIVNFLNTFATYPKKGLIQLVGMPNIELIREIQQPKFSTLPIYYTSPIYIPANHTWAKNFSAYFKSKIYTNPSLSAYKGFELIYYFTSLYSKYGRIEMNEGEDDLFKVLDNFQFKGIKSPENPDQTDYFENQGLYFIRRLNGATNISF